MVESPLHATWSLVFLISSLYGRDSFINPPRACLNPILGRRGSKPLPLIAAAKKKKSKKDDNHSFSARLDEATGPFPESILLKEKKIDEEIDLLPDIDDAEETPFGYFKISVRELYEFLDLQLHSDLNEEMMRHYEMVYLIREKHNEEAKSVNEKVQGEDEYEVDEDGNVVMVVYENEEGEEDGADELEQGHDQSNNAIRENRTIANVGGG
ncbi:hypothetical protein Bca52824_066290 [Brassica carinata]|uniref:Uncharacterized protein n=1 Tax=Brassica carinata TaxID=52824 RepID=A0A8X7QNR4_BRACI|nr:hypothetical protein Bca52824_066290 [Brassica carinata]